MPNSPQPLQISRVLWVIVIICIASGLTACSRDRSEVLVVEEYSFIQSRLWNPHSDELEEWQTFHRPRHIEPGPFDDLFVSDAGNQRIVRFWEDGTFEIIGREGEGPGEFRAPRDIFIDPENRVLFVVDIQLQRIYQFLIEESETSFIESFSMTETRIADGPYICPNPSGASFFIHSVTSGSRIKHVAKDGSLIAAFGEILDPPDPTYRSMQNMGFMGITGSNQLVFVSQFAPIIEKYDLSGDLVESIAFRQAAFDTMLTRMNENKKSGGIPESAVFSFIEEAYVPFGSDNVYLMSRSDLFHVVDTSTLEITKMLNIIYMDDEKAISPFCVIESERSDGLPTIYAIELQTGGIHKFTPESPPEDSR
ncbi:6-bladed beta-propeller [Gemmatimonadota bacterium]